MNFFKHDNLVYLCIPKHASTFYSNIFQHHLGWQKIDIQDIDWTTDKVFSHIMHPDVRHTKGTVQCITELNLEEYIDHPLLEKLVAFAIFDFHSQPIVSYIGEDVCYKIDWIPLDVENSDTLTNIFLNDHGVDIDVTTFQKENTAVESKQKLYQAIIDLKEKAKTTYYQYLSIENWFDRDMILYNDVICNIRPEFSTWQEISWFNNKVR